MGKIQVHEFMSLDGVIDTPVWTADYEFLPRMGEIVGGVTDASDALLLGRRTYELFYPSWSTRTVEDDPGSPFFNESTKYVVTTSLQDPEWQNTKILEGYDPNRIRQLKDSLDGDLYTSGSGTLVRAMLNDGLVDELHLLVYPLTRGAGPRLFTGDMESRQFELASAEHFAHGVVYLNYRLQG